MVFVRLSRAIALKITALDRLLPLGFLWQCRSHVLSLNNTAHVIGQVFKAYVFCTPQATTGNQRYAPYECGLLNGNYCGDLDDEYGWSGPCF